MVSSTDTLKPTRRTAVRVTLSMSSVAINILMLALPVCIMLVYDRVISHQAQETLLVLVAGLTAAIFTEFTLRYLRSRLLNTSALVAEHQQTMAAVDRILFGDMLAVQKYTVGDYLERLRSIERVREYHAGDAEHIRIDLAFAVVNLLLVWTVAGYLVLVPLLTMICVGCAVWLLSQTLRRYLLQRIRLENSRHDFLSSTMGGMHVIRSLAVESLPTRFYEHIQARLDKNLQSGANVQGTVQAIGIFGSQLVLVLFVAFGAGFVLNGALTLGALAAGTMLSGRVLQPLLAGVSAWLTYQRMVLAAQGIRNLMNLEKEADHTPQAENAAARDPRGARLELQNVAFAYASNQPHIFEHVNLTIDPLEMVGIVALNGQGKSTLMHLLLSAYQPTAGNIWIDGQPASHSQPGELTLLPQDGALFKGTLGQNLSFFAGNNRLREALRIADKLGLTDTIKALPLGLDTPIHGAHSAPLSSSVVQQILIARDLVGSPRLVLVDEASTALDPQADRAFQEVMADLRGRATVVIATNKRSLLSRCNRVLQIDQRRLMDVSADYAPPVRATPSRKTSGKNGGQ